MDIDKFIEILDNSNLKYSVIENAYLIAGESLADAYKIRVYKNQYTIDFVFNACGELLNIISDFDAPYMYIPYTGVP